MNDKSAPASPQAPKTFDAMRQRIRERFPLLSPHLQRIARASLEEPNSFALNTTAVIAAELGIQPSTLIRFAKEFGYSGFSELQKIFRQRLVEGEAKTREEVLRNRAERGPLDAQALLENIAEAHQTSLERLVSRFDTSALADAIEVIDSASQVYIAGLRRSRPIADYMHYGLIRAERACTPLDFAGGMAGPQIATMTAGDVLFAIAFPPYSRPVVDAVTDAYVSGKRVVALTDTAESPLAGYAEVPLLLEPDATSRFQPISNAIVLVHTLLTALTDG